MLGLFKPKHASKEPIAFVGSIEIGRRTEDVYPLIDLADARFAKRQLGEQVEEIAGRPGTYRMMLGALPELEFELAITERMPNTSVAFRCKITPLIAPLAASHELYRIEAVDANSCRLELTNTVVFDRSLGAEAFQQEALKMTISIHNVLAKLKLHAERGVEAVRAVEGELVVGWKLERLDEA